MKLQLKLIICTFLIIAGVFSVSQNCIYGQTSQQEKEGEKKVELTSHKVESNENSNKFIGQVHNMINKNVEYVVIIGTFYDENGKIIGSKSTYTKPSNLKPNMTAPFEMSLNDYISSNITSYDVTIT